MTEVAEQIAMSETALAAGHYLLAGGFNEQAGREADLAAFAAGRGADGP